MAIVPNEFPFITVCMPVRNEVRFIQDTLIQLLAQDYPKDRYEIIVADGESDDGTQDIVRLIASRYPQVVLKNNPKRFSSAGRNIGFKTGRGEIFVVVDGHCYIPTNKLLRNIIECFEKSNADCLGRPQPLDPPDISPFQKAVALARKSRIGHGGDSLIYSDYEGYVSPVSHGAVYKRHVFEKIGYVDESFDACEDVDFNLRIEQAGFKTYMSPSIAVKYYPRENLQSLYKQMVRYGRGRFRLLQKHHDTFSINSIIPTLLVSGLMLLPLVLLLNKAMGTFGLIAYGIYLLIILAITATGAFINGSLYYLYAAPIFIIVHIGLGYGFLHEAVSSGYNFLDAIELKRV